MTDLDGTDTRSETASVTPRSSKYRPAAGGDNIVDLLRDLVNQGTHLADQQLSLIKAEVRESAADIKTAIGGLLGAAVVGIAGLGVLLMGVAYLLAGAIEDLGLATVIVGAVTLLLAFILYRVAASKMAAANLPPERTQRTLQRTPEVIRGDS
nr:phage holin family protein [uncultured Sphingorhabdus sp.]